MKLKTVIIGLGNQNTKDHVPALINSNRFKIIGGCDLNTKKRDEFSQQYNIKAFEDIDHLLIETKPDVAIIAVPHNQYLSIIDKVAHKGIHIIKEKPFATNVEEAKKLYKCVKENNIFLGITLQRRYNPIFSTFHQLKQIIGDIFSIEGQYVMNIKRLDEGWRSNKKESGGGALIDMGYHLVDLLVWYMGLPSSITAKLSVHNRLNQHYDVEDTVHMLFDYTKENDTHRTIGNFIISRVYCQKNEVIKFIGTRGSVIIQRGMIQRFDCNGNELENLSRIGDWPSAFIEQYNSYANSIQEGKNGLDSCKEHFKHIAIIESAYRSNQKSQCYDPSIIYNELLKFIKE